MLTRSKANDDPSVIELVNLKSEEILKKFYINKSVFNSLNTVMDRIRFYFSLVLYSRFWPQEFTH